MCETHLDHEHGRNKTGITYSIEPNTTSGLTISSTESISGERAVDATFNKLPNTQKAEKASMCAPAMIANAPSHQGPRRVDEQQRRWPFFSDRELVGRWQRSNLDGERDRQENQEERAHDQTDLTNAMLSQRGLGGGDRGF